MRSVFFHWQAFIFDRFWLNLAGFCRIFAIRPRRNVRGPIVTPQLPHKVPAVCIFAEIGPYRASKKVSARSSARPCASRPLSATRASRSRGRRGTSPPSPPSASRRATPCERQPIDGSSASPPAARPKDTIELGSVNNIEYFPPNFDGLVLGGIDADFCK